MRALTPTSFDDVGALIALYRPGPMAANMHYDYADRKNGRKPVEYFHADARGAARRHVRADDLSGVRDAGRPEVRRLLAGRGRPASQGDGQEVREVMAKERGKSSRPGASAPATATMLGKQLFDIIERFADYAFNKSHAFGYGLVTYQTAYLKAHYPVEYFACLLTSVKSNLDKAAVYLSDCRSAGIKVLTPDINRSVADFAALAADRCAGRRHAAGRQPGRDHVRAVGGAQRRRGARRPARRRTRRERRRSRRSTTSPSGSPSRCSTSAPSSR